MYTRQAIYKNESRGATVSQVALKSYRDIFEGQYDCGLSLARKDCGIPRYGKVHTDSQTCRGLGKVKKS